MKCTILYGPPAVGKLTIARELAKITHARVFDNHQIINLVEPVVSHDNPEFIALVYSLQLQILNATMRFGGSDIILTFTFSATSQPDVALLQTVLEAGRTHGVQVDLIHLTAKRKVLLSRASDASRAASGKITDTNYINSLLDRYDLETPLPYSPGVTIDTTHLMPREVADQIIRTTKTD